MQAVVSFRKGLGVRFGSSQKEFKSKAGSWLGDTSARDADGNASASRASPPTAGPMATTRWPPAPSTSAKPSTGLNWLPLGGYVKMLGQDDLRPNSEPTTPAHTTARPSASEWSSSRPA
jgi:hypothetical protein